MTPRRAATVVGLALSVLLVIVVTGMAVLVIVQHGRVVPNTYLGGADVGGADADQLTRMVTDLAEDRHDEAVTFVFEDREFVIEPTEVGYRLDVEATVDAVMSRGRSGFAAGAVERVRALRQAREIEPVQRFDPQRLVERIQAIADEVDRPVSDGALSIDPSTLEVELTQAHGSARVRTAQARQAALDALLAPGAEVLELPAETTETRVDPAVLEMIAQRAKNALRSSITLRHDDDRALTFEPSDIARLLSIERTRTDDRVHVSLQVTPRRVDLLVDSETAEAFNAEPVNASYVVDRAPPFTFDDQGSTTFQPVEVDVGVNPGRPGTRFDPTITAEQLTQMVGVGLTEARLWLETVEPELPTDLADELRPTHLLSTFTTYHQAGQARVHNIQRLADTIDSTIVLPGEQFSINEISGRRTCEGGYLPAGTIVRGELVDTCGGGTSQFGTTTFNAAFFAGVQLDQWKAHSWYISRYPMGREATINYPELDVKFTNDTDGAVLVKTSHTPSSITVSVYGQPIAHAVRATLGSQRNHRSPSTQVRHTSELYEGQERVLQSAGGPGFTVRVVRELELINGGRVTQNIDTTYLPQHRIVERGTRPRPDNNDDDDDNDD